MTAIQIVNFKNDKLVFQSDKFQKILDQIDYNFEIVLVSIVGSFRTGKSLLLNFFLKHFGFKFNQGFPFAPGRKGHTNGIWVWDKPCLTSNKAFIFLDTQGLFDNDSNKSIATKIFTLSALISSSIIFNISKQIQEDQLEHLALFSEYAMVVNKYYKNNYTPLQDLHILIRDWQFEDINGDGYLKEILVEKKNSQMNETRDFIDKSYSSKKCTLLPHPGFSVYKENFKIEQLEPEFNQKVNQFVNKIVKNSTVKKLNGLVIGKNECQAMIESFVKLLNQQNTFPTIDNILTTTSKIVFHTAKSQAFQKYLNLIKNTTVNDAKEYQKLQLNSLEIAVKSYDNTIKIGSNEYYVQGRNDLLDQIKDHALISSKLFKYKIGYKDQIMISLGSFIIYSIWSNTCLSILPEMFCTGTNLFLQGVYTLSLIIVFIRFLLNPFRI